MNQEDILVATEFTAAVHRMVAISFCIDGVSVDEYRMATAKMLNDIASQLLSGIPKGTVCPSRR
jgi:DNA/RNA-binding domain of Phe-tRNA-synthetase-like protein